MKILREKYFKNMLNNQSLGAKKYFMELKDRELIDREEQLRKKLSYSKIIWISMRNKKRRK